MKNKRSLLAIIILLFALIISGCNFTTTSQTTTENITTSISTLLTTILTSTKEETKTTIVIPPTTWSESTTISPITETKTTSTTASTTKVNLVTPITDEATLSIMEKYYSTFDFTKVGALTGTSLIKYVQSFLTVAPGLTKVTYTGNNNQYSLSNQLQISDADPKNSSNIILFYSKASIAGTWKSGDTWNKEHVFAKSLGGFTTSDAAGYDMHHIRPTDHNVNSARGNKVFGNITHSSSTAVTGTYSKAVCAWTDNAVFEPQDSVKGDTARIVFYVSTMYYLKYGSTTQLSSVVSDKTFAQILEWNRLDPVDESEITRNNYVYSIQGNRNIFIDYPDLANYIWG